MMAQTSAYKFKGFLITYLLCDNERVVKACVPLLNANGITANQTSKNQHVPEVGRVGRTLKERVRAVWNTLPYPEDGQRLHEIYEPNDKEQENIKQDNQ